MAKKKDKDSNDLSEVELTSQDSPVETTEVEEKPKESKKKEKALKPLSVAATKWQSYLKQMNWTATYYLSRYPEHKYKEIIAELLPYEKNK